MNKQFALYPLCKIRSERGFSLVELMIVLALIGMIGGFVASVYLFSERSIIEWERNLRLWNELHNLADGISEDIYRAEVLEEIAKNKMELFMPGNTSRTYKMDKTRLMRNGRNLNSAETDVIDLVFEWGEKANRTGKQLIEDIKLIRLALTITDRRDTLELSRAVHLRKPLTWKPIREE